MWLIYLAMTAIMIINVIFSETIFKKEITIKDSITIEAKIVWTK